MSAEHTPIKDIIDIIIIGELALSIIASQHDTNGNKTDTFLCRSTTTTQQLNTIKDQLITALNNNTNTNTWDTYTRKQVSHKTNWKQQYIYSSTVCINNTYTHTK